MELIERNLVEYIDEVDSNSSAPGGGSVASLVGALGVALAKMLGHFSIEKKKFKEADSKQQHKFLLAMHELSNCKDILISGIDNDAISYEAVMAAYRSKDEDAIEQALKASAYVAMEIVETSYKALTYAEKLVELGNKNVLSDLVCSAILLDSCVECSSLNVIANAKLLKDEALKNEYLTKQEKLVKKSRTIRNRVVKKIS